MQINGPTIVYVYDALCGWCYGFAPVIERLHEKYGDRLTYASQPMEALEDAEALVIVTEWQEFRTPDFTTMKSLLSRPLVIDGGTGLLQPAAVGNTERVGLDLFLANPLAIELAGVVLLLSLIGAVVLARLKLQDEDRALVQAETGVSSEEVQPAGGTAT